MIIGYIVALLALLVGGFILYHSEVWFIRRKSGYYWEKDYFNFSDYIKNRFQDADVGQMMLIILLFFAVGFIGVPIAFFTLAAIWPITALTLTSFLISSFIINRKNNEKNN